MSKILIVSDTWTPHINGVVTTLKKIQEYAKFDVEIVSPQWFETYPNPFYPELRLAFPNQREIQTVIDAVKPDFIHIATEGPIGYAMRKWCVKNNVKFTTSYHTKFPEYFKAYFGIPTWLTYPYFKWFHNAGKGMFVSTDSLRDDLEKRGFKNCVAWTRGVDTELFCLPWEPMTRERFALYVGRVSKEKNIEAFLDLKYDGIKVVVGDGPQRAELEQKYPNVQFKGFSTGPFLAWYYQNAEVFVFPSKSDTFGLVMLEALACGTPVAAYNVTGPKDIIHPSVGCVDDDLQKALDTALQCDRRVCRNYAEQYSWKNAVDIFIKKITTS